MVAPGACAIGTEDVGENVPNVHPVGRNGMHRYNNQDHSMYTAMLTVENLFGAAHDIWAVNVDADYCEEKRAKGDPSPNTGRDAPVIPRSRRPAAASRVTIPGARDRSIRRTTPSSVSP